MENSVETVQNSDSSRVVPWGQPVENCKIPILTVGALTGQRFRFWAMVEKDAALKVKKRPKVEENAHFGGRN